ncbi:MAG: hypothetical protein JWP72_511 [Massilia sp.]|nr:hypothetical protein [Massilia sp.]
MNTKRRMKPLEYALAAALLVLVAGCGGGGGGGGGGSPTPTPPPGGITPPPAIQFGLGGTVSGLGQGVTVALANGSETIPAAANGQFTFGTKLNAGTAFNITATAPGGYSCKVTEGTGTIGAADSTKTAVACAPVLLAGAITALQEPQGVTSDANGNLYVVDGGPHSILKVSPSGTVTTLAGGTAKPGFADGAGASARFRFFGSSDIVSDQQGNLFVSDECNGSIRKLAADGAVSTLAGSGSTFCNNIAPAAGVTTPFDAIGQTARFTRPMRIVPDGAGGVVALDSLVPAAVRFVSAAGAVTTRTYPTPAGLTVAPSFYGIARANDGTLYFSDFDGRIWKDVNAALVQVAGAAPGVLPNLGWQDGTGATARFSAITDIVVAPDGNLYVGDASMVRRVTPAGVVTTIAGSTTRGFADGQGTAARLTSVRAMGLEGNNLIVIDNDQGALRRVTMDGTVSTLAATPALRGNVDGAGAAARFNWHTSLAADTAGSLYMADSAAHTIRKVTADGTVTTLAGKAGQIGMADGALGTATFNAPRAVAAGRDGSIWVAQNGAAANTGALRRIMGGTVSTVDPALQVTSLAVDASGNAIVTAYVTVNNITTYTVQRVTPAGGKTVLVDTAKVAGLIATPSARFVPQSVVLDAAGNIYISDTGTVAVYKLTPAGELSVFAGTPMKEGDADGAVGTATLGFYEAESMTIDDKGNLYLSGQGSVRMISPAGVVSTPGFVWGKESIAAVAFANGKLYGMTRFALLQHYLP